MSQQTIYTCNGLCKKTIGGFFHAYVSVSKGSLQYLHYCEDCWNRHELALDSPEFAKLAEDRNYFAHEAANAVTARTKAERELQQARDSVKRGDALADQLDARLKASQGREDLLKEQVEVHDRLAASFKDSLVVLAHNTNALVRAMKPKHRRRYELQLEPLMCAIQEALEHDKPNPLLNPAPDAVRFQTGNTLESDGWTSDCE